MKKKMKKPVNTGVPGYSASFCDENRRDDWIRTSGLFVPNEARYRAALHPENLSDKNNCFLHTFIFLFQINDHPQQNVKNLQKRASVLQKY
jgi:hypothetical protein